MFYIILTGSVRRAQSFTEFSEQKNIFLHHIFQTEEQKNIFRFVFLFFLIKKHAMSQA